MNEEEKQAIKELQNKHIFFSEYEAIEDYETENNINTILNLIEKQQKEIEKLKSRKYIFNAKTNEIKEIPISDDYIRKDKIEEKIKELEKEIEEVNENCPDFTIIYEHEVDTYGIINVLEELLGE